MSDVDRIAEEVRRRCVEAAVQTWEDAGIQGLCGEGRFEVAVGAIRALDVAAVVRDATAAGRRGS